MEFSRLNSKTPSLKWSVADLVLPAAHWLIWVRSRGERLACLDRRSGRYVPDLRDQEHPSQKLSADPPAESTAFTELGGPDEPSRTETPTTLYEPLQEVAVYRKKFPRVRPAGPPYRAAHVDRADYRKWLKKNPEMYPESKGALRLWKVLRSACSPDWWDATLRPFTALATQFFSPRPPFPLPPFFPPLTLSPPSRPHDCRVEIRRESPSSSLERRFVSDRELQAITPPRGARTWQKHRLFGRGPRLLPHLRRGSLSTLRR